MTSSNATRQVAKVAPVTPVAKVSPLKRKAQESLDDETVAEQEPIEVEPDIDAILSIISR